MAAPMTATGVLAAASGILFLAVASGNITPPAFANDQMPKLLNPNSDVGRFRFKPPGLLQKREHNTSDSVEKSNAVRPTPKRPVAKSAAKVRSNPRPATSARGSVLAATIDLSSQTMTVKTGGNVLHSWQISSGRRGYLTPTGRFRPQWMAKQWYSRKYDMAPMPYAVFFNGGIATHGTTSVHRLGQPASHGCIRLRTANARTFFNLVKQYGRRNTRISVVGTTPVRPVAVAQAKARSRARSRVSFRASSRASSRVVQRRKRTRTANRAGRSYANYTTASTTYSAPKRRSYRARKPKQYASSGMFSFFKPTGGASRLVYPGDAPPRRYRRRR